MSMCEQYAEIISAFMDGKLSEKERLELMEHLALCPACKDYFEDQLTIREAMGELEEAAPAGFAEAVMERVKSTPQEKKRAALPWRSWAAAAACCALALLGVFTAGGPADRADVPAVADYAVAQGEEMVVDTTSVEVFSITTEEPEMTVGAEKKLAPTPDQTMECARMVSGTITTASDAAKQWAARELELEWVSGQRFELTAEQYSELLQLLEREQAEFALEGSETGCWLKME